MNKEYKENIKLKQYLEEHINSKCKVNKDFKPFLVDILMRRAYEFELSPNDIQQDLESLLNNLESISIGKMPKDYINAAGLYIPNSKSILLSKKEIDSLIKTGNCDDLYEIFSHEVFHALSKDENGNDRLCTFNKFTKEWNNASVEAIVEKSADRCVFSRNDVSKEPNMPYFHQNKYGYNNITFITDAIAATYGVTEKDFLKNAIMGRERLAEFLAPKAGESKDESMEFLDGIDVNYSALHGRLYGVEALFNLNFEKNVSECIGSMYRLCEMKMQTRIENAKFSSIEEAKQYVDELKFDHNKLVNVIEFGVKQHFGEKISDTAIAESKEISDESILRISNIDQVLQNSEKFPSEKEALRITKWAQYGHLSHYENLDKYDINLDSQEFFNPSFEVIKAREEVDFSEEAWDNEPILEAFSKVIDRKRSFFGKFNIFSAVKQMVSSKDTLMLGTGEEKSIKDEHISENASQFGRLSDGDLKKFNEGMMEYLHSRNEKEIKENEKDNSQLNKTSEEHGLDDDL